MSSLVHHKRTFETPPYDSFLHWVGRRCHPVNAPVTSWHLASFCFRRCWKLGCRFGSRQQSPGVPATGLLKIATFVCMWQCTLHDWHHCARSSWLDRKPNFNSIIFKCTELHCMVYSTVKAHRWICYCLTCLSDFRLLKQCRQFFELKCELMGSLTGCRFFCLMII